MLNILVTLYQPDLAAAVLETPTNHANYTEKFNTQYMSFMHW